MFELVSLFFFHLFPVRLSLGADASHASIHWPQLVNAFDVKIGCILLYVVRISHYELGWNDEDNGRKCIQPKRKSQVMSQPIIWCIVFKRMMYIYIALTCCWQPRPLRFRTKNYDFMTTMINMVIWIYIFHLYLINWQQTM